MRNNTILPIAVMALALAGCNRGLLPEEDNNTITIKAVMAENNPTRTVIQEGTTSVLWEPADEVKVFYKNTGGRFTSNNTEPAGQADFTGNLTITGFFNEGFTADTPLWAVYPYRADATSDGESVTTTLPAEQTGRAGSFAKRTFITLAKSANTTMGFYNVCGGIRFSLTQEGIKEVVFQGQNDEYLAGRVKIAFADGVPAVQEVTEGQKVLTLTAPNDGTFETGKWYYIVALPGTLSGGFKMTFNTDTEYATLKSNKSVTIKRGIFGSLADADEDLIFKEKGEEPPVTGNIVFADIAAKYACVAKYDTDGDGEVSVEEAEAATSFEGLFTNWKGVVSFDEIRFFKNVHSLSGVFDGCNKLISITIPDNIYDLGHHAFNGCTSLTSVVLSPNTTDLGSFTFQYCSSLTSIEIPINVTSIGSNAFCECRSLSSVVLPSGVTSIDNYCFYNCTSLVSIDIPSGVTSIGYRAFSGCSSLGSIDLPANLTTIGQYAFSGCTSIFAVAIPDGVSSLGSYVFSGCSSLATANIPSGITSIPSYCFQNCSALISATIPASITSVGDYAFDGVKMWKLELPSGVSSLGSGCLGSIICVILPSTSPIAIPSNIFDKVLGIFVPSNLIDMYRSMTIWSDYASKLHPITAFRDKNEYTLTISGAVDMGTSVKWAAYNVGANSPEEFGDHFAWGDTFTKASYKWSTYRWCNGSSTTLIKYNTDNSNGTVDNKTKLDPEDDVAHTKWGGTWRMPTDEEWTELMTSCLWVWETHEDVKGMMVYSFETDNALFLPAAGHRYDDRLYQANSDAYYWSSTLNSTAPYDAWCTNFYSNNIRKSSLNRYCGQSVRPVTE